MLEHHVYLKFCFIDINQFSDFERDILPQIKNQNYLVFRFGAFENKLQFDDLLKALLVFVKKNKIKFLIEEHQFLTNDIINIVESKQLITSLSSSLVVDKIVRGGELIEYDGDIVLNNNISSMSDIKATGNIIVNSKNQGRLFAGEISNSKARIYMRYFDNCFVSIAGVHKLIEDANGSNLKDKSVMIFLNEFNRIQITNF